MSPEERDELLRKLAELAKKLRENGGDREKLWLIYPGWKKACANKWTLWLVSGRPH